MYSIYYKQKEYEVPQILFLQVGICLIEFKKQRLLLNPSLLICFERNIFLKS